MALGGNALGNTPEEQLKLVQDMEEKWAQLKQIVSKYAGAGRG